jgi:hypothetical protein
MHRNIGDEGRRERWRWKSRKKGNREENKCVNKEEGRWVDE